MLIRKAKDFRFLRRCGAPLSLIALSLHTYAGRAMRGEAFNAERRAVREEMRRQGDFTTDWFCDAAPHWQRLFDREGYADRAISALEIGSWEGMSACFLLSRLPRARLVAVDTWAGSVEQPTESAILASERRFDANTRPYAERLTKAKTDSLTYLAAQPPGPRHDLVYVDGYHLAEVVLIDMLLAFRLLKPGGFMILDDYSWRFYDKDWLNPAEAIHAFLRLKRDVCEPVAAYHQLILRKTAEDRM